MKAQVSISTVLNKPLRKQKAEESALAFKRASLAGPIRGMSLVHEVKQVSKKAIDFDGSLSMGEFGLCFCQLWLYRFATLTMQQEASV
jgi:hypothetical protein